MTASTTKGIPYPQNGIDYLIDVATQLQSAAEAVDTLLDDYRLLDIGGLTFETQTLEANTVPIGTTEAAVLTSDQFVLTVPTRVQLTLSWGSLTATVAATAQFRLRPGNIGATPVGGAQLDLPASRPAGGGSITCCPLLPAGTYTILATLQVSAGQAVLNASATSPATLLVRPLP